MFRRSGVVSAGELESMGLVPPRERLIRGAVAVTECIEEIPCNVCESACPVKAIRVEGLRGRPRIDWDRCTGCGVCVGVCPGQAMFLLDLSRGAAVTVPYEFLPRLRRGDTVELLDREGRVVGEGTVIRVFEVNKTQVVTVSVPENLLMEVRAVRRAAR
ncbi:4Fe-4S binding protein [Thermofilum pendens]|uniref:4Fe-4S ferredoxin, iron-sulfur binding domain protein n=1 Tax=Thermofilum pendens (strain DSM 2475 / Hrk 5) TaxID=368408 RepID=A1RYQ7_THEPD|nr:4Fe-4S binding protein [Thermofilum pendens]ABL78337.1 4Fe-4S ferredoxin, iron-sulfur binding domain protein [Thermofilum pendens Hrk 5]